MKSAYTLCIRQGEVVTWKSELPTLYKYKDIGFEDFEDPTEHDAKSEGSDDKELAIEDRLWYSAGKGLEVFQAIKAKTAAGERFELPRTTVRSAKKSTRP